MCAGGLQLDKTHALDACLTAMEFRDFALRMQELNSSSKDEMMPWELGLVFLTHSCYWGNRGNNKIRI